MSDESGNGKRGISARISEELYKKTRVYVIEHSMSYEEWIERAMERYYLECTNGIDESAENGTEKISGKNLFK